MRLTLTIVFVLGLMSVVTAADPPSKLNVIFIMADDLGWGEVGCYGQEKIPTPNIDRLAREGLRFTQFHSGAPVCAPSRCVLMTGKHLGHAEVRGNQQAKKLFPQFDEGQTPLTEQAVTWPMLLQKAGYATGAMGKWGLGPVGSTGEPNRKGFDLFFGYNCQSVAHSYFPPHLWRNSEKVLINNPAIPGHQKKPEGEVKLEDYQGQQYAPKLMIAEAEKFLAANTSKPFLLYLAPIEPHVAMHPPAESVNRFPKEWDQEVYRGANGYLPHPRPRAAYAAMISDLDSYVGRILDALDKAKLADRTLVIFTSDNGTTHGQPADPRFHVGGADPKFFNSTRDLRGFKGSVYEGGIRVPAIARLPGRIPAGTVNDTPGYHADWFPTICDALGIQKPAGLDGESLWSTLTDGKTRVRTKPLIFVFPEYQGQVAVQIGDLKAVRTGLKTKKPGEWEVYNLAKDRGETNNIAAENGPFLKQVEDILRKEVDKNEVFPLTIPGVN
ncbi:MAG TPA: arylsulfatase [Caulifigura sp.]|nr:arylsulfatase [Caulifigura sp.]